MTTDKQIEEPLTFDGLNAYDVIRKLKSEGKELPYGLQLPSARSMTQARIDYDHLKHGIVEWYNQHSNPQTI